MSEATLIAHRGARPITYDELALIEPPAPTATWFPAKHSEVYSTVVEALTAANFGIKKYNMAIGHDGDRMFATLDLTTPLSEGVALSVGIRNSNDKSFPLGFCAGSRVFVCDNLAFKSDLLVKRKHTRFGSDRFEEAICQAVQGLTVFKEAEMKRIESYKDAPLSDDRAAGVILKAYEKKVISHLNLAEVIQEWREPTFPDFRERNLWSLFNAFTFALRGQAESNPQRFASTTIHLQEMLDMAV